jgi:hypothetical protein
MPDSHIGGATGFGIGGGGLVTCRVSLKSLIRTPGPSHRRTVILLLFLETAQNDEEAFLILTLSYSSEVSPALAVFRSHYL